jgi:hypothetical protein
MTPRKHRASETGEIRFPPRVKEKNRLAAQASRIRKREQWEEMKTRVETLSGALNSLKEEMRHEMERLSGTLESFKNEMMLMRTSGDSDSEHSSRTSQAIEDIVEMEHLMCPESPCASMEAWLSSLIVV